MTTPDSSSRAREFEEYRRLLFSVAYRMLGEAADAEDVVQEAYLRWDRADGREIRSAKSYLTTIVTRLSLDRLRAKKAQREAYIGPWLPEPIVEEPRGHQAADDIDDSLSLAFLTLLEALSPAERAAFLLREVFDYEYKEIAGVIEKNEANCRQLVRRARQRLGKRERRFERSEQARSLMYQFQETCLTGDLPGLEAMLAKDVTLWSDGGGKIAAATKPLHGADRVLRFLMGLAKKGWADFRLRPARINGLPGLLICAGERVERTVSIDVEEGRIRGIYIVGNPDKLRGLSREPLADPRRR